MDGGFTPGCAHGSPSPVPITPFYVLKSRCVRIVNYCFYRSEKGHVDCATVKGVGRVKKSLLKEMSWLAFRVAVHAGTCDHSA